MLWKNIMLKVILVSSNALRSSNLAKFYSKYLFLSWLSAQLLPCFPIVFPTTLISHFTIIVHCMNNIDIDYINLMNEKEWSKKPLMFAWKTRQTPTTLIYTSPNHIGYQEPKHRSTSISTLACGFKAGSLAKPLSFMSY